MLEFLQNAKQAFNVVSQLNAKTKNKVLNDMADALTLNCDMIINENIKDVQAGKLNNLSKVLLNRLFLDKQRIYDMATSIKKIALLKEPIGRIYDGWNVDSGLKIQKVSVPIGVVGIIYESRPNVTSDTACLCFKSGNVCILKGGKEAQNSNKIIAKILQGVLGKNNLPLHIISLLPDSSRQGVENLIKQDKFLDLIIPRGGHSLISFVSKNATVPVIKHDKGLCHTFIDKDANIQKALNISINAKCRRVEICGAMETLLVHKDIASVILPALIEKFEPFNTLIKGCQKTCELLDDDIKLATNEDFQTEYLDNILSIKIVKNVNEAIEHIQEFGSHHSDAIITENYTTAENFLNKVDSACVYLNASTQFTDGGEFGFGAEVGISTNKIHARGPMGINELTTYKFKIYGNGQIR
jgi:glutamate-5-semialdehyde dehydrogenase